MLNHSPEQIDPERTGSTLEQVLSEKALDVTGSLVVVLDATGRVVRWNPACEQVAGRTLSEVNAAPDLVTLLCPEGESLNADRRLLADLLAGRVPKTTYVNRWRTSRGETRTIAWSIEVISIEGARHVVAAGIDVSDTQQAEGALRASEERFRLLAEAASDVIYVCQLAPEWALDFVSPSVEALTGYRPEELYQGHAARLIHPEDRPLLQRANADPELLLKAGRLRLVHRDGTVRWVEHHGAFSRDDTGTATGLVGTMRDVTDEVRVEATRAPSRQAFRDSVTGLPDRATVQHKLESALRAGSGPDRIFVLFCDLDRFKLTNDSLGHAAGDVLLRAVADRLRRLARPDDIVGHAGGDEFVIACLDPGDVTGTLLAHRILSAFEAPFQVGDRLVYAPMSIGVSVAEPTADAAIAADVAERLIGDADAAMYRAKQRGGRRAEAFDSAMQDRARRRWELETAMHGALERAEFEVYYQPQVDLDSGRTVAEEALLRWRPTGRSVAPKEFVPLAEETGLIVELGAWVLHQACAYAVTGPDDRTVAVNLSARQLTHPRLIHDVTSALAASGLPGRRLCLEITETVLMEEAPTLLSTLHSLRDLGVEFAIDDFGTGYSSLVYLKRLPVSILKIDQRFVGELPDSTEDDAIVASIIRLAGALGLGVIAEGVETTGQRQRLTDLGCQQAQGYLFGRPAPARASPR
jgi:diguanylate cyclase (GGDEF)-like protein/PAS domain S-box-containing protein